MKTVAFYRKIANVLKCFTNSTGETLSDAVTQSVLDYVNILSHVCGDGPNRELAKIVSGFEIKSQVIFKKINDNRRQFLRIRREEALLLDKKLPSCDNRNYVMISIPEELYNGIIVLIERFPYVFSNEKKATIKDVVNRAILFRVIENDLLMQNEIYRIWRLETIMRKESGAKMSVDEVFEIISKKRKVTWNE
jgi:hypothetical protein